FLPNAVAAYFLGSQPAALPAALSKCKYCQRERGSMTKSGSEIKWRRPQGRECNSCPNVQRSHPQWLGQCDNNAETLSNRLESDGVFLAGYVEDVDSWESKRSKKEYTPSVKKTVSAYQSDECVFESVVGYLRPLAVYKREKKCEPKQNKHQVQTIDGRKCAILDASHGTHLTVPGGGEIFTKKRKVGVTSSGELANTAEGSTDEQVKKAYKAGQTALATKARHDEDTGEVKVKSGKLDFGGDPEGEESLLLDIWGSSLSRAKNAPKAGDQAEDGGTEDTPSKLPKKNAGSKPDLKDTPAQEDDDGEVSLERPTPVKQQPVIKRAKIGGQGESALMKLAIDVQSFVNEMCTMFRAKARILQLKYDSKIESLKGEEALMSTSTWRGACKTNDSLGILCALLDSMFPPGPDAKSSFLLSSAIEALAKVREGYKLEKHWDVLCFILHCQFTMTTDAYVAVTSACSRLAADSGHEPSLAKLVTFSEPFGGIGEHLDDVRAKVFVAWAIGFLQMTLPADAKANDVAPLLAPAVAFVKAWAEKVSVADSGGERATKFEGGVSSVVLFNPDDVNQEKVDEWTSALEDLTAEKKSSVAKSITRPPSREKGNALQTMGNYLRARILLATSAWNADKGYLIDLEGVDSALAHMRLPSKVLIVAALSQNKDFATRWQKAFELYRGLLRNSSTAFQTKHGAMIKKCSDQFEAYCTRAVEGLCERASKEFRMGDLEKTFVEFATKVHEEKPRQAMVDLCEGCATVALVPPTIAMGKMFFDDTIKTCHSTGAWLSAVFDKLMDALPSLHAALASDDVGVATGAIYSGCMGLLSVLWPSGGNADGQALAQKFPAVAAVAGSIEKRVLELRVPKCTALVTAGAELKIATEVAPVISQTKAEELQAALFDADKSPSSLARLGSLMRLKEVAVGKDKLVHYATPLMIQSCISWHVVAAATHADIVEKVLAECKVTANAIKPGVEFGFADVFQQHLEHRAKALQESCTGALAQQFGVLSGAFLECSALADKVALPETAGMTEKKAQAFLQDGSVVSLHSCISKVKKYCALFARLCDSIDTEVAPMLEGFSAGSGARVCEAIGLQKTQALALEQKTGAAVLFLSPEDAKASLAARLVASFAASPKVVDGLSTTCCKMSASDGLLKLLTQATEQPKAAKPVQEQ
ncbi:unnamed protein product, partial [Prorocentrum cordatum]